TAHPGREGGALLPGVDARPGHGEPGGASSAPSRRAWVTRASRDAVYEAANVLLTRVAKGSALKAWGIRLATRSGLRKARLPSPESLPSSCIGCGPKVPNSSGPQRRLPVNLHSRTTEFPPTSGNQCPCRDAGVGAIAPSFAMLVKSKTRFTH